MEAQLRMKTALAMRFHRLRDRLSATLNSSNAHSHLRDWTLMIDSVEANYNNIFEICDASELHDYVLELDNVAETYRAFRSEIEGKFNNNPLPAANNMAPSPTPSTMTPAPFDIRPPRMELPIFDGNPENWPAFSTLFADGINQYPSLTGGQKLLLLSGALKGPAKQVINYIPPSPTAFDEAWALLTKKYEATREIAYSLVRKILELPLATTAVQLEKLVDTVREIRRALALMGFAAHDSQHVYLNAIVLTKVDNDTLFAWQQTHKNPKDIPPTDELLDFLQTWGKSRQPPDSGAASKVTKPETTTAVQQPRQQQQCPNCKLQHFLPKCPEFTKANVDERWAIVKKLQVCFNCLSPNRHDIQSWSLGSCRAENCNKKHHTMLHKVPDRQQKVVATASRPTQVLLATAILKIKTATGQTTALRAFLDPGAQVSLISQEAVSRLQLKETTQNCEIVLAGGQVQNANTSARCSIVTKNNDLNINPLVVSTIGLNLPTAPVDRKMLQPLLSRKKMADPKFDIPSPVDILLGAAECAALYEATTHKYQGLIAQKTSVGWVLFGAYNAPAPTSKHLVAYAAINEFQKFWELEDLPQKRFLSHEEQQVEDFFSATTQKDNGRFIVKLPLKEEAQILGNSRGQAVARLRSLERKFATDSAYEQDYRAVMDDYIAMGHLEPADSNPQSTCVCYLPHHAVVRKEATTTKLRVVFDASAKTSNGKSLNDIQANVPTLQNDIFTTLVRFRSHQVALTADIVKMYRQIQVNEEDRDLQRIVWRAHPSHPVKDYRLTTVTFGQKVAPYLAIKVLKTIATEIAESDPAVSSAIFNDFYVDDLLTGTDTTSAAICLQQKIAATLLKSGLPMHKWASNDPTALSHLDDSQKATQVTLHMSGDNKTLGLKWNTTEDTISVVISNPKKKKWTRRSALSSANSIYDPLGWFSPVTVTAKIILQKIIHSTSDWDEPLLTTDEKDWTSWTDQLRHLADIQLPRSLKPAISAPASSFSLCGFSDASEKAYAAVVYARTTINGSTTVRLVAAKSKVAPLKPVTLPRLELLGAALLAKLMGIVSSALQVRQNCQFAYTDSTITLAWIRAHPSKWQTFVANRVAAIQEILPSSQWSHVKTADNPADLPSRGIPAESLQNNTLWWHGPAWLQNTLDSGPTVIPDAAPEQRKKLLVAAVAPIDDVKKDFMKKHSSFQKMRRLLAYVFLFVDKTIRKTDSTLQPKHFKSAETTIFKWVQQDTFSTEIAALTLKKPVPLSSSLAPMNPFLDENGLMRAAGRLQNAPTISYDTKNPVILPTKHHVTGAIIRSFHTQNLHAGPTLLQTLLRQKFWIPRATNLIKSLVRTCITCQRARGKLANQMMASLPEPRVTPVSRPFTHCGLDYCGPVMLKTHLQRGTRTYKGYIAIFVCFATRAIHIELVTALTTEAFIASLTRMCSRRGVPKDLYSDRGSNFCSADKEIQQIIASTEVSNHSAEQQITWHFNPPAASHFGGLWEAGVKSVKTHLKRVIGKNLFTYEEYATILCKIEAVLNSRPLLPASDDPQSLEALTPAHFLVGGPLQAIPEEDLTAERLNTLRRWQLVQRITQDFWTRWSKEYLTRLHQRPKWWRKAPNIEVGRMVLIQDPNRPPLEWRLGRVIAVHQGKDNIVRACTIKTAYGEMERPIVKLCVLPLDCQKD